jgi:DNA-binding response OmpR family regulator
MSDPLGRLLIVDDDPEVLGVLAEHFSPRYEVMTAQHGPDALMIASYLRPDAVLVDIFMPGWDGVQILRAIRALDGSVPVVMLSNANARVARDTMLMGAFDCIPKPIDLTTVDRVVVAAIAAGAGRAWSAFDMQPTAPRTPTLTRAQVVTLLRTGRREPKDREHLIHAAG